MALLLTEFLDRCGDVAFVEVGDDARLDRFKNQINLSPAESPKSVLTQNLVTHSNALERPLIIDTIFSNGFPVHRLVRPVRATGQTGSIENAAKT